MGNLKEQVRDRLSWRRSMWPLGVQNEFEEHNQSIQYWRTSLLVVEMAWRILSIINPAILTQYFKHRIRSSENIKYCLRVEIIYIIPSFLNTVTLGEFTKTCISIYQSKLFYINAMVCKNVTYFCKITILWDLEKFLILILNSFPLFK